MIQPVLRLYCPYPGFQYNPHVNRVFIYLGKMNVTDAVVKLFAAAYPDDAGWLIYNHAHGYAECEGAEGASFEDMAEAIGELISLPVRTYDNTDPDPNETETEVKT